MIGLDKDAFRPQLPAAALVTGAASLLAAAVTLLAQPTLLTQYLGSPRLVALTHAFTLLYVTLVYAGTLQQLPAVMFVTKLVWPRLGYVSLPTLAAGAVLLVVGFGSGMRPALMAVGAVLVCLALGAVLLQLLRTAGTRPPRDSASRALITAVCYLFLTVLLGLALAAVRARPVLASTLGYHAGLHQQVGLFGAFLLGIAGSGHKLLSMFALSKGGPSWRLRALTYLVHVAVAATVIGLSGVFGRGTSWSVVLEWLALAALVVASGLHLWEVVELLRRRLRKRLEASVMRYVVGHAFLPVAAALLLCGRRDAAAAAFLLGFVGLAVSGMLIKILSFLTWTAAYSAPASVSGRGGAGHGAPPLLRDLLRHWLEPVTTWGLGLGAAFVVIAVLSAWPPAAVAAACAVTLGAASQFAQTLHIVYKVSRAS